MGRSRRAQTLGDELHRRYSYSSSTPTQRSTALTFSPPLLQVTLMLVNLLQSAATATPHFLPLVPRPLSKHTNHTGSRGLPGLTRSACVCPGVPQSFSTMIPHTDE